MADKIAGIDVHKKVLMVVVIDARTPESKPERRRFATMPSELRRLSTWLQERGVEEAVMESTAQYWRSVWLELEPHMCLLLAQAFSNRAPRGRKHDFKDAERLVRRLIAKELILSFVPDGEQRIWRNLTRMKLQLTRDRVRIQSQIECLLEEMRIKLSIVVSDLLGSSGLRILHALANGETDAKSLALLGDDRLKCTEEQLVEALTGRSHPMHGQMLALQLERLRLLDEQIAKLNSLIAQAMKPHQDAVIRLAEVPGLGIDSAQQVIAEVGVTASTFSSAAEFTSGVNLSRKGRKRRRELQQPFGERQQIHAPRAQPGRSCRCPEQRHPLSGSVPASAAASGLSVRCLGHRTSPMPLGLEDSSSGNPLHRARHRIRTKAPHLSCQIPRETTS